MSSCISTSSIAVGVVHVTGFDGTVTAIGQVISGTPLSVEIKKKSYTHDKGKKFCELSNVFQSMVCFPFLPSKYNVGII